MQVYEDMVKVMRFFIMLGEKKIQREFMFTIHL